MKTILIGWELGEGLGHVMRLAAFARALAAPDVRVVAALADLSDCARVTWPRDIVIVAAPQPRKFPLGFAHPSSYAELLFGAGYNDLNQVAGLLTGWFNLLDLTQADVVLADHAPAAHLAARLLDIPVARVGTGFFAPPPLPLTPTYRDWGEIDTARAPAIERHVLSGINAALTASGGTPASSLSTALRPDAELIASWPEFDCYAHLRPPGSAVYIGNENVGTTGIAPQWPALHPPRKRIVAYLKGDYAALPGVLATLRATYDAVAYVSGLRSEDRQRFAGDGLWLAEEPMDLSIAAEQCDALICHAGAGTAPQFLAAGKPVLLLPYSAEQRVNAARIAATGAGRYVLEADVRTNFAELLEDFCATPQLSENARKLASDWAGREDAVTLGIATLLSLLPHASRK